MQRVAGAFSDRVGPQCTAVPDLKSFTRSRYPCPRPWPQPLPLGTNELTSTAYLTTYTYYVGRYK